MPYGAGTLRPCKVRTGQDSGAASPPREATPSFPPPSCLTVTHFPKHSVLPDWPWCPDAQVSQDDGTCQEGKDVCSLGTNTSMERDSRQTQWATPRGGRAAPKSGVEKARARGCAVGNWERLAWPRGCVRRQRLRKRLVSKKVQGWLRTCGRLAPVTALQQLPLTSVLSAHTRGAFQNVWEAL